MSQSYSVVIVNCFLTSGMGIVCENTNFCSSETDFLPEMFVSTGKKRGVQKIGSIGFSSAVSTRETFGAHSCMVVTCLSCFNYEQSGLLLLFLQAGISTECSHSNMLPSIHAMFRQEKGNVSKVLKRFAMSVAHVFDGGEKFDDSGRANMWQYFVHSEKNYPKSTHHMSTVNNSQT